MTGFARTVSAAILFLAAMALSVGAAPAHPGGHGPIGYEQALAIGAMALEEMVEEKFVEMNWKGAPAVSAERVIRGRDVQWVVIFKNPHASDPAKRTLYVFFDAFGEFIAAHHTAP